MKKQTVKGQKETSKVTIRRENALSRLQQQLKSGTKPLSIKNLRGMNNEEYLNEIKSDSQPLTEKDVKRINKEILTLKSKI